MIKYILVFTLAISQSVKAQNIEIINPDLCPKVKVLDKGQAAPCDGFYFSDEAEKEAAEAKKDAKFYKEVNDQLVQKSINQTKESEILERRLKNYIDQTEVLSNHVAQRDNTENLYRFGYFALGALITGFIAANVK